MPTRMRHKILPLLQGCYEAFRRRLNATHAVACVPGTQALSDKGRLGASLEAAYGPAAWGLVPRSFRLPHEFGRLAAHLKQVGRLLQAYCLPNGGARRRTAAVGCRRAAGLIAAPAGLLRALPQEHAAGRWSPWVLKEDVHRGKGVGVATPAQALLRALQRPPGSGGGTRHVLAQRFLGQQFLVGGRPFYIR